MQVRSKLFIVALVGLALAASSASAATVHYILDLSVANNWSLSADVSQGDNGGLVFYDVPLTGNVLTLDHRSPLVINSANFLPAGFNVLRTPAAGVGDPSGPMVNPELIGSQDAIGAPPANRVYGFGQEASSWAAKGIVPAFSPDATADNAWVDPLLLARGTYDMAAGTLGFNTASLNLVANVWESGQSSNAPAADVTTQVIEFPIGPTFMVDDGPADQGGYLPGQMVTGGPLGTNDDDNPDQVQWLLQSLVGPGGPVLGASVDPLTGEFSWQSLATSPLGAYSATIRGTNALGATTPAGSDTGAMGFNLVPEPGTLALLAFGMIGLGLARRRGC